MTQRGINILEAPTSLQPPVTLGAGLPFVVGTAPITMGDVANINKAVLVNNYEEFVAAFGFAPAHKSTGLFEYSLCEFAKCWYQLFGGGPMVAVNVLDPSSHTAVVAAYDVVVERDRAVLQYTGIITTTIVVKDSAGTTTHTHGTDYDITYNPDGHVVVHRLASGAIPAGATLKVNFTRLNPEVVDGDDIIGGVDVDGKKTGLELIADVFPKSRLVPGFIAAPGFSDSSAVAAVMRAKAKNINGVFNATAVIDVPTGTVTKSADVAEWKNTNGVTDANQIVCWPMVSLGGEKYHMSTQLIGLANQVDGANGGVPYESPSNKNLQMDSLVLRNGVPVVFGQDVGSMLNAQGIVTATNFANGWVLWGNRTAAYPGNTDVKDAFIPIRRVFNWVGNTIVLSNQSKLDKPLTPVLAQIIVDSLNAWGNGLVSSGYLLAFNAVLLEGENPIINLMDGKLKIRVRLTPPSPLEQADFVLEYDPAGLTTLFS